MSRRNLVIAAVLIVLLALPLVWWLAAPLFVDETVDEAFPFDLPEESAIAAMSPEEAEAAVDEIMDELDMDRVEAMPEAQAEALETGLMQLAERMPETEMAEAMPEAADEWLVARQGSFRDADAIHRGSGEATVYQQGERRVLRFTDFEATNGPDLHVLLVENVEAGGHDELGDYVDLGSLKGNVGDQNYELPADLDLDAFGGVMIYCMPFHVVFTTAAWEG